MFFLHIVIIAYVFIVNKNEGLNALSQLSWNMK